MAKVPARCNRRACQARRTLSKHPLDYVRWPKCHIKGCAGKMYVDTYRLAKGPYDRAPECRCDGWARVHRRGQVGCVYREEHIIERSLAGSKAGAVEGAEVPF